MTIERLSKELTLDKLRRARNILDHGYDSQTIDVVANPIPKLIPATDTPHNNEPLLPTETPEQTNGES